MKSVIKKRVLLTLFALCLFSAKSFAEAPQMKLSLFPHIEIPFANSNSNLCIGAGAKYSVYPFDWLEVFGTVDYDSINYKNRKSSPVISGSAGAGYVYRLNEKMSLSASLQAGVYRASYTSIDKSNNVLYGINGSFNINFSYRFNPTITSESEIYYRQMFAKGRQLLTGAGLSTGIGINLSEVFSINKGIEFEILNVEPVFPVLYSWYDENPFGTVKIANNESSSIKNVKVSFYQQQYMSQPTECMTIEEMQSDESVEIPLLAFFNDSTLNLTESVSTYGTVIVEYYYIDSKRTREFSIPIDFCNRNSMNWEDDRRASVFVSKKDVAAAYYSKNVMSAIRNSLDNQVPENLQVAAAIFESLREFGVNYVIDPNSSYVANAGQSTIDFLQFPHQTLMYRGGDCDDLSILCSSLFEAAGIETGFVTTPGHIFVAINTGVPAEKRNKTFRTQNSVFEYEGYCWAPVEITLITSGFIKAWKSGVQEWNLASQNNEQAFYPAAESHKVYKPVSVPGASIGFDMVPDGTIKADFNQVLKLLRKELY